MVTSYNWKGIVRFSKGFEDQQLQAAHAAAEDVLQQFQLSHLARSF